MKRKVVIMGAAGRDFHNFNVFYRGNPLYEVVAFTATQIPNIEGRVYPPSLAGQDYPQGIPIVPEGDLPALIKERGVHDVVFSYSDVSHLDVMHKASLVLSGGANFILLGARETSLKSHLPVISVGAVRTGVGKSQTTRKVAQILKESGLKTVVARHPMPYGNLSKQVCMRFEELSDLEKHECTIEEGEEFAPHLEQGTVVYAGVDYEVILREAEKEAEVILWEGGNNDLPFFQSDLHIVLVDPHRPGHELLYHPGEANLRMADVVIINKVDTASLQNLQKVRENVRLLNPHCTVVEASSPITLEDPSVLRGKKALAIEDGPTLTHGEMAYGAAFLACKAYGASQIVDPRPYAVGSIAEVFRKFPHLDRVLPAMGYSESQRQELARTIEATPCDLVVIGTPYDLRRVIHIGKPAVRVTYELCEATKPDLKEVITQRVMTQNLMEKRRNLVKRYRNGVR